MSKTFDFELFVFVNLKIALKIINDKFIMFLN